MKSASFWRSARLGPALVYAGVVVIWVEALLVDASHGIFKSEAFAERVATSLGDPRVSGYVAEKLTDAIVEQRPNLIALRPLIVSTMGGLVQSQPFRAVARRGLAAAQASLFSEEGKQVLLSVPDVGILLRSALAGANPELASKIPDRLDSAVGRLEKSRAGQILTRAHTVWERVKWLTRVLLFVGPLLVLAGIGMHRDRRRGLVRAGIALIVTGLFIALLVPFGRLVALWLVPHDIAARAAVFGVWRAYFLGLFVWATDSCRRRPGAGCGRYLPLRRRRPVHSNSVADPRCHAPSDLQKRPRALGPRRWAWPERLFSCGLPRCSLSPPFLVDCC